jgi:hypothetical protein
MPSVQTRRENFVAAREPLPHRDFCARLGVAPDTDAWIICIRRAMARLFAVPPSALYPRDTWRDLLPLLRCDWDDVEVVLSLGELGVEFPSAQSEELPRFLPGRFFWKHWPAPATFGDWVVAVAEHLDRNGCRRSWAEDDKP